MTQKKITNVEAFDDIIEKEKIEDWKLNN